ncbi:MAG: alpha/beta hydrolase [Chloroflexi bacterium]|uniref:Alpha/beta hydrolase n=1 Tax=Candidatus Chlorohelix allophototropha TaxID=3003348 RepID=A0A8T7M1D3_9CHLR|nr:alpha/beta hydrolase [Chloroflexota bacterium]WJW67665.1 alpha/beta hydrolase [Chloroflexota bacterium L227-S17]
MSVTTKTGEVTTGDGITLRYIEAGAGQPLVMIPGWSQTAAQYRDQIEALSDRYRVISLDMRGHGESDKPNSGYRIARFSQDLHDVLVELDLQNVVLLGHSMGCSIIWSYWDTFGAERISKLVLIDQVAFVTSNPAWSAEELEAAGAIFDHPTLVGLCNGIAGAEGVATSTGLVGSMFTGAASAELKQWAVDLNLKLPRQHAATLLYNHCTQDWRDVIPQINVPSLVIGGTVSIFPAKAVEWVHQQIPGSQLAIFNESEGGSHFMFIEGAAKLNNLVRDFIG